MMPAAMPDQASSCVDSRQHGEFMRLLSRRLDAEPTGYIVGAVELLGLRFKVDRRGFIRRLDLPVLINAGLERVPRAVSGFALGLACGLGAAGVCVGHARPGLRVARPAVSRQT